MQKVLRIVVILLVALGTLTVLQLRAPEERTFTSDDGLLTLSGSFTASEKITIDETTSSQQHYTAVVSSVYQFYPSDKILSAPARLSIIYPTTTQDADTHRLALGFFDQSFNMWRSVDSDLDAATRTVSTQTFHLGRLALLQLDDVARPNIDAEIESLIASPPQGAVGYQLELGYADVPGDFVILPGAGKTGGCAGQYKTGESTQMTSRASVFSEHLEYQVVALWQIGEGCQGLEVIE